MTRQLNDLPNPLLSDDERVHFREAAGAMPSNRRVSDPSDLLFEIAWTIGLAARNRRGDRHHRIPRGDDVEAAMPVARDLLRVVERHAESASAGADQLTARAVVAT